VHLAETWSERVSLPQWERKGRGAVSVAINTSLLSCMWPVQLVGLPVAGQSLVKTDHPSVFEALVRGLGPF
jgi:hypothetical protein